jgi:AraC family transcriptional activator of pobA
MDWMPTKSTAAKNPVSLRFFDPAGGSLPFRLEPLGQETLAEPVKSNCFTILWVKSGEGQFHADLVKYPFAGPVLLFANPYQTLFIESPAGLSGALIHFHANFLCIETHHEEVGCNGVLFNRVYGDPVVPCNPSFAEEISGLIGQIEIESTAGDLAHREAVLSLMKILLIRASRMKLDQLAANPLPGERSSHPALIELMELIESHYHTLNRPADYAARLAMTPKTLGRIVKEALGKTLSDLIRERRLKHAKWQLLHTVRPVKEIAAEVGFPDEFYFSRIFKAATGLSPTAYREFETRIRGGSNLSM